jgi:hypothetical protein
MTKPTMADNPEALMAAAEKVEELEHLFEMQWAADQRAIKRWQAAHPGNDLVWPDRADMVVWLMGQYDAEQTASENMITLLVHCYRAGTLSEGQVSHATGLDRVALRQRADEIGSIP